MVLIFISNLNNNSVHRSKSAENQLHIWKIIKEKPLINGLDISPNIHPLLFGSNVGSVLHGLFEQDFLCWVMSGEICFRLNNFLTSTKHFYCFHRAPVVFFLAGSHYKSSGLVCMRINPLKVFKRKLVYLPDLWKSGKMFVRLTCSSENIQNWPTFSPTNVDRMLDENVRTVSNVHLIIPKTGQNWVQQMLIGCWMKMLGPFQMFIW